MAINHLHLGVDDVERSVRFYGRLGFADGTWHGDALFLRDSTGFDLALAPHGRGEMPPWFHFGIRLDSADAVRELRGALEPVSSGGEEDDFVWFRVHDPDGYQIEVYWEA